MGILGYYHYRSVVFTRKEYTGLNKNMGRVVLGH